MSLFGGAKGCSRRLQCLRPDRAPSTREGTPNVVLESMACGVPVIASEIADNAFIVRNGETGFLFPVGDVKALTSHAARLLTDSDERTRIGAAARRRIVSDFSLEAAAGKLDTIYRNLLPRTRNQAVRG